jgi:hypothetical protein
MSKKYLYLSVLLVCFLLVACGHNKKASPLSLKPEKTKPMPSSIAVLPVINHVADPVIGQIVRQRLIDELFFKGYPKISTRIIDERLARIYEGKPVSSEAVPPMTVGELMGVDGVLYCRITEMKTKYRPMYAPTRVELSFEMRSTKTGETLWQAKQDASTRNFGFTRRGLEMKSFQDYEAAIGEIFKKVMKTFPEGPDAVG